MDYKSSGVNIEEGYKAVEGYKAHAKRTSIAGVMGSIGSFSGLFSVPSGMKEPILVSGTDGVGTKLEIAFAMKKYDTVGIDCVAMCVNDVLCVGARPLFFLDYIACGKLDAGIAEQLVKGVADGCLEGECALIGGETAEMPGFYELGKYDIAGFSVGVVEKASIISGAKIAAGDTLIGLSSSGVHSNGFSLVRKLVSGYDSPFMDSTIGEILLTPTRIYVKIVRKLLSLYRDSIHGMCHITGGGFYENIPRMYTYVNKARAARGERELRSLIKSGSWSIPDIFYELQRRGADKDTSYNTFNMGIGYVLAVDSAKASAIIDSINEHPLEEQLYGKANPLRAYAIGEVAATEKPIEGQRDAVIFTR